MIQPHFQLEQLTTSERAQIVHGFQVIQHIDTRNTAQHIKAQLVAQETAHGHQSGTINIQAEIITLQGLWIDRLPGYLSNRGKVSGERCVLVTISSSFST
jgi:hypothetical protein